jgi:hypothetical protein
MAERPEYLTVPEVMARLRLGRTTVYEQARLYLATDGAEGIPCRRFGRSLRFPGGGVRRSGRQRRDAQRDRCRRSRRRSRAQDEHPARATLALRTTSHARGPPPTRRQPSDAPVHALTPMRSLPLSAPNATKYGDALAPAVLCGPVRRPRVGSVGRC